MGGTSNYQNISYCVGLLRSLQPQSVLDVGVGFGRWGILCREFLEVAGGKYFRDQWNLQIDGIEAFRKNIDKYHSFFYDRIFHGDAFMIIDQLKNKYDLIILGDVLEHFEKQQAIVFLRKCLKAGDRIMLNIPIGPNWEQGIVYGNKFEQHLSVWDIEEFKQFPIISRNIFKDEANRSFATIVFKGVE